MQLCHRFTGHDVNKCDIARHTVRFVPACQPVCNEDGSRHLVFLSFFVIPPSWYASYPCMAHCMQYLQLIHHTLLPGCQPTFISMSEPCPPPKPNLPPSPPPQPILTYTRVRSLRPTETTIQICQLLVCSLFKHSFTIPCFDLILFLLKQWTSNGQATSSSYARAAKRRVFMEALWSNLFAHETHQGSCW